MHYDISGPGADEVQLNVWSQEEYARRKVHSEKGKSDGYFEADFIGGNSFYICFKSFDSEEKDVSFMVKQVTKNKVEFAKMDHIDKVNQKMKDMQDDFDVISHNLSARMNSDADMAEALLQAKKTQTYSSALKAFVVVFMCAMQTYFITCIFRTKDPAPFSALSGSMKTKAKDAADANKDAQEKMVELV